MPDFHLLYFEPTEKSLYYIVASMQPVTDVGDTVPFNVLNILIQEDTVYIAESLFVGGANPSSIDSHEVYKSYSVGYSSKADYGNG